MGIAVVSGSSNLIEKNKVSNSVEYDLYEVDSADNTWAKNKYDTANF